MLNKLSDITIIIESNEKGKVAQALIPQFERKLAVYDSLLKYCNDRIFNLQNSIIEPQKQQIINLRQVIANDSVINLNNQSLIRDKDIKIAGLEKQVRRAKTKNVLTGLLGIATTITAGLIMMK